MSFLGVASSASLLICLILLVDCGSISEARVAEKRSPSHLVVKVDSLIPAANTCSTDKASLSRGRRRSTLSISHRDGPCSPLRATSTIQTTNLKEYSRQLLLEDKERVSMIQKKLANSGARGKASNLPKLVQSEAEIPVRRSQTFGTGNYVVTVGVGTPKVDQSVIFDTGSHIGWIQCAPCSTTCYPQQESIFDPLSSSSYTNVSCSDTACQQLISKDCDDNNSCQYRVRYGDGSSSDGSLSKDALTLTSASGTADVFPGFIFGCGQNNHGLFGTAAGLIGLSRNPLSVVSQTASRYGSVFSYCLPRTIASTGYLNFGPPEPSPQGISYTPMLSNPRDPDLYFLRLTGITVEGELLPVSTPDYSSAGTIIDSGTVITRLPMKAYAALRSAFRSAMSNYKLGEPLNGLLDTCYNLSGTDTVTMPVIALQFDGGAVAYLSIQSMLFVADVSQVCLAFAGYSDDSAIGIIGNVQQRGLQVVYDIKQERIGFGPGTCANA